MANLHGLPTHYQRTLLQCKTKVLATKGTKITKDPYSPPHLRWRSEQKGSAGVPDPGLQTEFREFLVVVVFCKNRTMSTPFRLLAAILALLPAACGTPRLAIPDPQTPYLAAADDRLRRCAGLFVDTDARIIAAGAADVQSVRIPGFPYLRASRFLASFRGELDDLQALAEWIEQLRRLDIEGRMAEVRNGGLNGAASIPDLPALAAQLQSCGRMLVEADLDDPQRLAELHSRAIVGDSYSTATRFLGAYFLTRIAVGNGIRRLHQRIARNFSEASEAAEGVVRYGPADSDANVAGEPMPGIETAVPAGRFAQPDAESLEELFRRFAPIWEIEHTGAADRPGQPRWSAAGVLEIDGNNAITYRLASYTRVSGISLLQLNYIIWFPERPLRGPLDLLGGHIDGINWRVTLGPHGEPLFHDAMHNCGCYHMFFPVPPVRRNDRQDSGDEPLLVPANAPRLRFGERIAVRIESGTHYITGIHAVPAAQAPDRRYRMEDYGALRSLPLPAGGYRSMFGGDGIVPGTSRRERWLLWPMGVADPGAMRQWGHHATAFVGRRHFDDPYLLDRYFEIPIRPGEVDAGDDPDFAFRRGAAAGGPLSPVP
jgi:hypothetical protein